MKRTNKLIAGFVCGSGLIALMSLSSSLYSVRIVNANVTQSDATPRQKRESEFESIRYEGASKNPSDISFVIRLAGDKKQFRQGEIVRLEMSFSSGAPNKYKLETRPYDRSGRLHMDKFLIDPAEGSSDPMYDHFNSGGGFIGGGLSAPPSTLNEKSRLINYDLNEWFRFDRAGIYRLYITSPRVRQIGKRDESDGINLTSNVIEFEITPAEKEWLEKELRRIVRDLDAKDQKTDRRTACRELRFLGSKAAALEMLRRFSEPDNECGFEYYAGLIGSPHRDQVLETMETQIAAPGQPVSSNWLQLMIKLAISSGRHGLQAPTTDDERLRREYWGRHREISDRLMMKYTALLAQSIHVKTGVARAVSAATLLDLNWDKSKLPQVTSYFSDLPLQQQGQLLQYRWKQISGDSMLPILRGLYGKRRDDKSPDAYDVSNLNALALKRIYQLAPEEGRRLIIDEMRRPRPKVDYRTLIILPDETIPELDSVFIENFEKRENTETHSSLIERYASSSIFNRVREILDERIGKMSCHEQSRLLAYCLRINPSGSIELMRRAANAREKEYSKCYTYVFREVGDLQTGPELEKLAIGFLNDADPEVVIDVATMLGRQGSSEAEEPLWRRFEKWHREWSGREQELKAESHDDNPVQYQTGVEQALRVALSNSPGWLTDSKKLERIKQLCVTQNERQQVDYLIQSWSGEIYIRFSPAENEWGSASVAHYDLSSLSALKKKLAQFPKGVVYKWEPFNEGYLDEEKEKLFRELESFLAERGARLIK